LNEGQRVCFVFSDVGEEVRTGREVEEMFCWRGMTYELCSTRPFSHAKKTAEDAKQTFAENCPSLPGVWICQV
jgi:hypothetical protein